MAVELQAQTLTCKCGTEAPQGAKFCFVCGKRLPKPQLPAPESDAHVIRQVDPVLKHAEACRFLKCSAWMLYELGNQEDPVLQGSATDAAIVLKTWWSGCGN